MKKNKLETLIQSKLTNKNKPLFGYILGEIWFTELKSDISLVSVTHIFKNDSVTIIFNLETNSLFTKNTGAKIYIIDKGLVKNVGIEIHNQLELDKYKFWTFKDFKEILTHVPTYKRSFIVNVHRIFETVKNTTNGPVVVGGSEGKAWYQRYWWAIIGCLAALALLAYMVLSRRKK